MLRVETNPRSRLLFEVNMFFLNHPFSWLTNIPGSNAPRWTPSPLLNVVNELCFSWLSPWDRVITRRAPARRSNLPVHPVYLLYSVYLIAVCCGLGQEVFFRLNQGNYGIILIGMIYTRIDRNVALYALVGP